MFEKALIFTNQLQMADQGAVLGKSWRCVCKVSLFLCSHLHFFFFSGGVFVNQGVETSAAARALKTLK